MDCTSVVVGGGQKIAVKRNYIPRNINIANEAQKTKLKNAILHKKGVKLEFLSGPPLDNKKGSPLKSGIFLLTPSQIRKIKLADDCSGEAQTIKLYFTKDQVEKNQSYSGGFISMLLGNYCL